MTRTIPTLTLSLLAATSTLAVATPADAAIDLSKLQALESSVAQGKQLYEDAKKIATDYESLPASIKEKLKSKKERMKNGAKSFLLVLDAVKDRRPLPVYFSKSSGLTVACGDKVWVHNAAQDLVLASAPGKENTHLNYVRVNVEWANKSSVASANFRVMCRSKADGKPLAYGDEFLLKLDPASGLADGKPYFHAGTKTGYDPVVRLGDKAEIDKWSAYWKLRGGEGTVQTGIPMEIVATNRKDDGNVGGLCGVGPGGLLPVVEFGMSNHCGVVELVAGVAKRGVGTPPKWTTALAKEVKALAAELREEIEAAGK